MNGTNITSAEAAQLLGVSERRVVALIHSGDLEAQKFGKSWAVSEESVRSRLASGTVSGRPPYGQKRRDLIQTYTLMNKNDAILHFVFDNESKRVVKVETDEHVIARSEPVEELVSQLQLSSPLGSLTAISPKPALVFVRYSLKPAAKIQQNFSFKRSGKTSPINIGSDLKVLISTGMRSITFIILT